MACPLAGVAHSGGSRRCSLGKEGTVTTKMAPGMAAAAAAVVAAAAVAAAAAAAMTAAAAAADTTGAAAAAATTATGASDCPPIRAVW